MTGSIGAGISGKLGSIEWLRNYRTDLANRGIVHINGFEQEDKKDHEIRNTYGNVLGITTLLVLRGILSAEDGFIAEYTDHFRRIEKSKGLNPDILVKSSLKVLDEVIAILEGRSNSYKQLIILFGNILTVISDSVN